MEITKKSILFGFLGGFSLLVIYFIILTLVNGPTHILTQLKDMWYWILLLVIGFGIQISLYSFVKMSLKAKMATETGSAAASGGISTVSMIACCAHHLSDVLPLIGLSAASVFLVQYQVPFIIVGIVSNVAGIFLMLNTMKEHNLSCKYTKNLFKHDLKTIKNIIIVLGVLIVAIAFLGTALLGQESQQNKIAEQFQTITLEENSVTFKITPTQLEVGKEMIFDFVIDTHTTDLNFDLTKTTILETNSEETYLPTIWGGSPPGGHHRSGKLSFEKLKKDKTETITIIISNVADVAERKFVWQLE